MYLQQEASRNYTCNPLCIYICASECVDLELREKKKLHSDLEKAEKLKSQLASEVDEHHSAIERMNDLNLR